VSSRNGQALAVGSAVSGVLAYVFFSLTTRSLGPVAAAPVSVLWTYWSFTAATLTFPVQHWISRSVAAHGTEAPVRRALPRVFVTVTALSVLTGLLAWLAREPLFHTADLWFPVLVGLVTLGSAANGTVRGALTARYRFVDVGVALVGENGIRVLTAVALVLLGLHTSVGFALCLAAGPLIGLAWPSAWRFSSADDDGHRESAIAFLAGAGAGQLMSQFVLTGAPVVLALAGGAPAQVTAVFVALALFRAPYTVALGVVAQLTGRLTTWVVEERWDLLRKVRLGTALVSAAGAVLAGVLAAWIGLPLIRLVFGPEITLPHGPLLMLAAGSTLALGNLVMTVLLMALDRSAGVAIVWGVALLLGAAGYLVVTSSEVQRTCVAFLVAEAAALVAALIVARPHAGSTQLPAG
jgi:O-antigen/teichoic acid export membrane protein